MPQPKYQTSKLLLNSLKWELEKKVYHPINSKLDCRTISQLILHQTGKNVSESTLYRLFLWSENQHKPYLHTLEIIAEFLNYKSWFELEKRLFELIQFQYIFGTVPNENKYRSLISFNLNLGSLKPLYLFLEQFSYDLSLDKKAILGEEIFLSLKNNTNNLEFFKQFHSLSIVREGFYEIFADPDFTINQYEIGLKFYLKHSKPHESQKALQDYIFANSLLLRHYFLNGLKDKVLQIGKLLYLDLQLDENTLYELHVFPKSRYLSYKLLFHFVQNGFNHQYWDWLLNYSIDAASKQTEMDKRIVIHTLLDVLQIHPSLQEKTYNDFKAIFPEMFIFQPSYVKKLSIEDKISFFDANGSRFITKNKARVSF